MSNPTMIGLKNLRPGDKVKAHHEGSWQEVVLVSRVEVPWHVDLSIGPVWMVNNDHGKEWKTTGEFMDTLN